MALTEFGVNHPAARKHWSSDVFKEALKRTYAMKFMGTGTNSLVQVRNETQKGKGDRVRFNLRMQLTGAGVSGDGTLEGNEEALTIYTDDIFIDQLRHAVRSGGKMSEQRVPFEVREQARDGLADWFAGRVDEAFFNQIAGNVNVTDTRYTGSQSTLTASGSGNFIIGGTLGDAGASATASLTALATAGAGVLTLQNIDRCVELAQTRTLPIRPIMMDGNEYYVLFVHPHMFTAFKNVISTTQTTWYDIQRAAVEGGRITESPLFTGAAGVYNNTIIHVAPRLPANTLVATPSATFGVSIYTSVFCGAQAAVAAFGRDNGPNTFSWTEEYFDYENQLGVACGTIWGVKKTQFNGADFATIQIIGAAV